MLINQQHIFTIQRLSLPVNFPYIRCDPPLYVRLCLPNKLISKSCRSSTQILRIPSLLGQGLLAKPRSSDKDWAATPLNLDEHPAATLRKHHNTISVLICEAFSCS